MKRRTFTCAGALTLATAVIPSLSRAIDDGIIGSMPIADFKRTNTAAGLQLKTLRPTTAALSEADSKRMALVAAGGMMQLEASRLAVQKASSRDVRVIAEAEIEEQTVLGMKLQEFAAVKQVALPTTPHKRTASLMAELQAKAGDEFDRAYLKEVGVKNHEILRDTMIVIQSKATDPGLRALAMTTFPLISFHLEMSRNELDGMF